MTAAAPQDPPTLETLALEVAGLLRTRGVWARASGTNVLVPVVRHRFDGVLRVEYFDVEKYNLTVGFGTNEPPKIVERVLNYQAQNATAWAGGLDGRIIPDASVCR